MVLHCLQRYIGSVIAIVIQRAQHSYLYFLLNLNISQRYLVILVKIKENKFSMWFATKLNILTLKIKYTDFKNCCSNQYSVFSLVIVKL